MGGKGYKKTAYLNGGGVMVVRPRAGCGGWLGGYARVAHGGLLYYPLDGLSNVLYLGMGIDAIPAQRIAPGRGDVSGAFEPAQCPRPDADEFRGLRDGIAISDHPNFSPAVVR